MFVPIVMGIQEGSQTYSTPGTYSFTVPEYNTLSVTANGGGGSGGFGVVLYTVDYYADVCGVQQNGANGSSGGASSFNSSVVGNGGGGGTYTGSAGSSGTASGGDTNTTGGGASGGGGGGGGTGSATYSGSCSGAVGGNGGNGGKAVKTYAAGSLTVGASITVVVGAHGTAGMNNGSDGSVVITWS